MTVTRERPRRDVWQLSLRERLIFLVVACVVPLATFTLVREHFSYREAVESSGQKTLGLARSLSIAVEKDLQAHIAVLRVMALSRLLQHGDLDAFRQQAELVVAQQFPGTNIVLIREDGQQVMNTLVPIGAPLPVRANIEADRAMFATGQPTVSNLFQGTIDNRNVVTINVPVRRADGTIAYGLSISPRLEAFADTIRRQHLPEGWLASVFDRHGVNIARNVSPERYVGQKAVPALVERVLAEREGVLVTHSREGIEVVTAFSHVEPFGWSIAMGVPLSELTAPAVSAAWRVLAAAGVALLVGLILAVVVSRQVTGPMATLQRLATRADDDEESISSTGLDEADGVVQALRIAKQRRKHAERREVAERQSAQAALERSDERFRYLFLNSPLPMWVYNVANFKFLEVNDAAISVYGYSRDEFLAMTLLDIRPPEDVDRVKAWFASVPHVDRMHSDGWRHRRKDGQITDVEVYLHDIEFLGERARLGLVIDITERKRTERESRRILETSQDVIVVTNSYGRFLQVSPSAANVLGYQPEEMIGRLGSDIIAPEDLEATRNEMRAARRGSATRNFRTRYRHRDGHLVPLVWMAVWSEPDRRHFFIGRDMTEYERTAEQLRQAQKMESVGQLTGGLAHDFNNILMVIMANAEELEEEELPPHVVERIEGITNATQRAADLTRQLLAFSRKQPLRPQRININDLVATTGKLLRRTLGEQIEIQSILAADLWDAEIDRAQLESALVNLSINARDAMPNGGRLLVETSNATLDGDYVLQNPDTTAGDYVILAVSDTGAGMPQDVLAKVFEPFFTTKGVGKGTGLGLSMVYGFIKQSRGHIKIYSEVGHGTSIRLYMPRSDGVQAESENRAKPPMLRGTERILVVEDDPQVRASVVRQLESLGYAVFEAMDGPSGLAAFDAARQAYDLLLTDIIMPGPMNGKMLAAEVTSRRPETKVVFMSGYTENAIIHHGKLDEDVLLLSKPFRKQDLAEIVRRALDGSGKVDR